MGGPVTQLLARRHPERVGRLRAVRDRAGLERPAPEGVLAHDGRAAAAARRCSRAARGGPGCAWPVRRRGRATGWPSELSRGSARDLAEAGRELGRFDSSGWADELPQPRAVRRHDAGPAGAAAQAARAGRGARRRARTCSTPTTTPARRTRGRFVARCCRPARCARPGPRRPSPPSPAPRSWVATGRPLQEAADVQVLGQRGAVVVAGDPGLLAVRARAPSGCSTPARAGLAARHPFAEHTTVVGLGCRPGSHAGQATARCTAVGRQVSPSSAHAGPRAVAPRPAEHAQRPGQPHRPRWQRRAPLVDPRSAPGPPAAQHRDEQLAHVVPRLHRAPGRLARTAAAPRCRRDVRSGPSGPASSSASADAALHLPSSPVDLATRRIGCSGGQPSCGSGPGDGCSCAGPRSAAGGRARPPDGGRDRPRRRGATSASGRRTAAPSSAAGTAAHRRPGLRQLRHGDHRRGGDRRRRRRRLRQRGLRHGQRQPRRRGPAAPRRPSASATGRGSARGRWSCRA